MSRFTREEIVRFEQDLENLPAEYMTGAKLPKEQPYPTLRGCRDDGIGLWAMKTPVGLLRGLWDGEWT